MIVVPVKGVEIQKRSRARRAALLGFVVALGLGAATFPAGSSAARKASPSRCTVGVELLRGKFAGTVTPDSATPCTFARIVAETSLRAIIRTGRAGNGDYVIRAASPRTGRRYRLRCAATGDLYSGRGVTADCRAGAGGGEAAVHVLYRAHAVLDLGSYLEYAYEPLESYRIGPAGVPVFLINGSWVDHPDGVAQWGLREYSHGYRRPLLTAAHWLAKHERPDGGIPYMFDYPGGSPPMFAPWISALSQSQAISVLMRAYQMTGFAGYLRATLHAFDPFLHPVPVGLASSWDGHPWYEEYPAADPDHVLNGFMFALVGLHELAPRSPVAWRLFRAGVQGLIGHIAMYDVPDQRTQMYAALGAGYVPVGAYYARTDAVLVSRLARWTHDPLLKIYASRWTSYTR